MQPSFFTEDAPGELLHITSAAGNDAYAFLPNPLPPNIPNIFATTRQLQSTALALGSIQHLGYQLPNPYLLIRPFISREAIASSRIEGTQADYAQLVLAELEEQTSDDDVEEVRNYLRALEQGWQAVGQQPFSIHLFCQLHEILMTGVRGSDKDPGKLRDGQVYIAGDGRGIESARFVPPPPFEVRPLLNDLCAYLERPDDYVELIRLALFHYQFETIHPFKDGNGRLGRLLMPLLLMKWGLLGHPMLYLSEFFEQRKTEYIDLLFRVSTRGDWLPWIVFVLEGISAQAKDAARRGARLLDYREHLRSRYTSARAGSILRTIDALFEQPSMSSHRAMEVAGIQSSSARQVIDTLVRDGVLVEVTGYARNRRYLAPGIMDVILGRDDPDS